MRTRIIRDLSKQRAEIIKAQYEGLGWSVEVVEEGEDRYKIIATK